MDTQTIGGVMMLSVILLLIIKAIIQNKRENDT